MKEITKKTLEEDLKEATASLLDLVRKTCWNTISDNTVYILSEIGSNSLSKAKRKQKNDKKVTKSLQQITTELQAIYENLYDINLFIYKSERKRTIIEVQYYPKSLFDDDYYQTIKDNAPMLHCKIAIPNYLKNKKKKFDVNWELGGFRHRWNTFLGNLGN